LALVEGLRHEGHAAAQIQVALVIGLGAHIIGFSRRERGARIVYGQLVVGGIEDSDDVAGLHDRADIDRSLDDLARDAEAERALDAGHDRAGQQQGLTLRLIRDLGDPCRPDDGFGAGRGTGGIAGERIGRERAAGHGDTDGCQNGQLRHRGVWETNVGETHGGPSFRRLHWA